MNENGSKSNVPDNALDPFRQAYESFVARYDSAGLLGGYPTGFNDLDRQLDGLQKGELVLITGEPSMGKTTFASNIACHVAITSNIPVEYFTFETKAFKLAWRMLIATGRMHSASVNAGKPLDDDWSRLTMAIRLLSSHKKVQIVDSIQKITEIIVYARSNSKNREQGLIVIDYLQLAADVAEAKDFSDVVEKIFAQLKILAIELNIPVIIVANNSIEFTKVVPHVDAHLNLSNFDNSIDKSDDLCVKNIEILKARNAKTEISRLLFLKNYIRFDNLVNGN